MTKSDQFTPGYEIHFDPPDYASRSFDLLERLRETKEGFPQTGSGWIDSTGTCRIKMNPAPRFPVNPDGRQAADLIETLGDALQSIRGVGALTRRTIDDALLALRKARGEQL